MYLSKFPLVLLFLVKWLAFMMYLLSVQAIIHVGNKNKQNILIYYNSKLPLNDI